MVLLQVNNKEEEEAGREELSGSIPYHKPKRKEREKREYRSLPALKAPRKMRRRQRSVYLASTSSSSSVDTHRDRRGTI